jgi:sugar phosphate isomerase/epimerase
MNRQSMNRQSVNPQSTIGNRQLTRRDFLEAAAALLVWPPQTPLPGGMFISLPPWAVARNVGWPEQARLAARVGYAGIDWPFQPARQAGADATRALLSELGIRPTITNLPLQNALGGDDAAFTSRLPQLADDAAFSAAIGCRNFQLVLPAASPPGLAKQERWKAVRDRLTAISGVLAKHGIRLGLEFLGPLIFRSRPGTGEPFVWTLADTVKLAAECGSNIGVTLDAWHWHHSGGTVADILATAASRIVHVHVSDARQMAPEAVLDHMRLLPGEGIIDLAGFFGALEKIGYRGGVAPETIGPRIPDSMPPEDSARLALQSTASVMRKAGVRANG